MTDDVTGAELAQFVERFEALDAEKRAIAKEISDLMAEAKARGYDTKALREVLRLRRMKPDDRAEFEAVVDLYRQAMGV